MAINQLVLSKYLFQCGQNELNKNTSVSCGLAISLFQDSVELLIRSVGKDYDAKITDHTSFATLWERIDNAKGNTKRTNLPLQAKMLELNKARVYFKHYGILPDVSEGRKFSTYAEDFLRETMELFFDKDFDEISLADLIQDAGIRKVVKEAEKSNSDGDFDACMVACAKADQMISKKVRSIIPELPHGFTDFGMLFDRERASMARSWVQVLDSYLRGLRHFSIATTMNIKLPDYVRFHAVVPDATEFMDGSWRFQSKRKASKNNADFCLNYVIKYAFSVQEQFV